ncbi:MAG: GNAT family N-acetyltransferase [Pseudomonadota bacterium]
MQEELDTARLRGRPVRDGDGPFLAALFGAPEVGAWTQAEAAPWTPARAAAEARAFAAHWTAHRFGLRVWSDAQGPAALAGLQFCVIGGLPAVEAAFAVRPDRQRRGLAREAMTAALEEAPQIAAWLHAATRPENAAAEALLRRLGFARVAEGPPRVWRRAA